MGIRILTKIALIVFAAVVSFTQALAAPGDFVSTWATRQLGGATVRFPLGNWMDIANILEQRNGPPQVQMLQGERWIVLNRSEIGMLGLSSAQMSNTIKDLAGPRVQIFAHYSKESAQLRIHMVRLERRPNGRIYVSTADFTPHHGEFYRAYQNYTTRTEKATGGPGWNPFRIFRGDDSDPVFYNIGEDAALVAIGHAMRLNRAPTAWLAWAEGRFDVWTETSGNIFSRRTTTHVDAYAKPRWYFVAPLPMSPAPGRIAQICVDSSLLITRSDGTVTCDFPEHFAYSGVVASEWTGGNLPTAEQLIYSWSDTRRSFTVLTFSLVAPLLGLDTGAYGLASTVFRTGGSLTQAQDGFIGPTGPGTLIPTVPTTEQEAGARQGVLDAHVSPDLNVGLNATQTMYRGTCDPARTNAECLAASKDPGIVYRPDAFAVQNSVAETQRVFAACKAAGFTGAALQQCAAPQRDGLFGSSP